MIDSAGLALSGLSGRLQKILTDLSGSGGLRDSSNSSFDLAQDTLSLSDEAAKLFESNLSFARERLQQIDTRIAAGRDLLGTAGEAQAQGLFTGLESIFGDLGALGAQLRDLLEAQGGGSAELNVASLTYASETITVTADEDGLSIERVTEITQIVAAELRVTGAPLAGPETAPETASLDSLGDLLKAFQDTSLIFARLLGDAAEKFGGIEKIIPVPLFDLLESIFGPREPSAEGV